MAFSSFGIRVEEVADLFGVLVGPDHAGGALQFVIPFELIWQSAGGPPHGREGSRVIDRCGPVHEQSVEHRVEGRSLVVVLGGHRLQRRAQHRQL